MARAIKAPANATYERVYEPDMERMVKALKIVLALPAQPKQEGGDIANESKEH